MKAKLDAFAALLESEQRRGLLALGYNPEHHNHKTSVYVGRKYANVDIGDSGRYMVDLATGGIFGIKGYGVIHRGHYFGTLDTVGEWDWSDYRAIRKVQVAA